MPDFNLCVALLSEQRHFPIAASTEEPDPLPQLLPQLITLSSLLEQCRFPDFWRLYHSEEYDTLRDNYTVECKGFEQSVREVAVRAVRTTFLSIGEARLSSYLNLQGPVLCTDPPIFLLILFQVRISTSLFVSVGGD
jgi:translation initiation factor 3 subunit K